MKGNILGINKAGTGGDKLNVYAQLAEPSKKDGIWIKTTGINKYNYTGIQTLNEIITEEYIQLTSIPYSFSYGSAVAIGNDVYLFGGSSGTRTAYKYNISTNSYTRLTSIEYSFYDGSAVAIDNDVYLFGGSGSGSGTVIAYKYNSSTNTYTQLTSIPYKFSYGSAVAIGNDVYLFGSGNSSSSTKAYKYNSSTNTYTQLIDIPYQFRNGSAVAIDNDVYLYSYTKAYKHENKPLSNGYIYILTPYYTYKIKLSKLLQIYFDNAYIYDNNALLDYPCYYGDGTNWNLI